MRCDNGDVDECDEVTHGSSDNVTAGYATGNNYADSDNTECSDDNDDIGIAYADATDDDAVDIDRDGGGDGGGWYTGIAVVVDCDADDAVDSGDGDEDHHDGYMGGGGDADGDDIAGYASVVCDGAGYDGSAVVGTTGNHADEGIVGGECDAVTDYYDDTDADVDYIDNVVDGGVGGTAAADI